MLELSLLNGITKIKFNQMENSKKIYCTVLKNLSKDTSVEKKALEKIENFEKNANKFPNMDENFYHGKALADFHILLTEEIKTLLSLQEEVLAKITFKFIY